MEEISLEEFAKCIAVLMSGMGKSMPTDQIRVYHQMLKDLPLESLQSAIKRALCEHNFATIPTIAMLRNLAFETDQSEWQEASRKVFRAARIAYYEPERVREIVGEKAMAALESIGGISRLADLTSDQFGTFSAQFKNAYESLERNESKRRVRTGIESQERNTIEARAVSGLAGKIGVDT